MSDLYTFAHRRLMEIGGGIILIIAIAMALALFSYDATDPSWNTASTGAVANLLGPSGARISDFVLQVFGIGAWMAVIIAMIWSLRLCGKKDFADKGWRVLGALVTIILAASLAGVIIKNGADVLPAGLAPGGLVGEQWRDLPPAWVPYVCAVLIAATLIAFSFSCGWTWTHWWRGSLVTIRILAAILLFGGRTVSRLIGLFGRSRAPSPRNRSGQSPVRSARSSVVISRRKGRGKTSMLPLSGGGKHYIAPPLTLLSAAKARLGRAGEDAKVFAANADLLLATLQDFGVSGKIIKVRPGPIITLYELVPAPGIKASRVINLADDIARSMSAISARIAPISGRNALGIELPNRRRESVILRELLQSEDFAETTAVLPIALGKDIGGGSCIVDLAAMPHLLVAGTTGSGKSVAVNAMILSLLYRLGPQQCKLILIDPKMLELSVYDGIPHLIAPVVVDPKGAITALKWTVREMERRYRVLSRAGTRSIAAYNQKCTTDPVADDGENAETFEPMPMIVVIVDEMADLMISAGKEIEIAMQRLSQMARAAGIHIIMATQRPSVDVITGVIKANFPTRISFQVTSKIDSRTVIGEGGAEQLLGKGDMLYMTTGGRIMRAHGPFVADKEVLAVVSYLKKKYPAPEYIEEVLEDVAESENGTDHAKRDDLYRQACDIVKGEGRASTSFVQRRLQIGYNRAARLMEQMEADGIVSPPNHAGKRDVLAS